jgi:HAMP domain-containing protein
MRISLDGGLIEAGLAACISSFCLTAFSASPEIVAEQPPLSIAPTEIPAVERLQQQQQILFDAVERIRENSDLALQRYTDAVLTQFNLVQEHFAAQEARNVAAAQRLDNRIQVVLAVMIAGMILSLLVIAWIPLWATNRMTRRIIELSRARGTLSVQQPSVNVPEQLEVESALNRLEERLLSLENGTGHAAPEPPASEPALTSRTSMTPRVALAVGEGSALMFLPHEVQATRWLGFRSHWKKLWTRGRPE